MANKNEKIIIIGDGEFAQIAYEYFTHDSSYEVAGFSAEREYLNKYELYGLPVVPFEELENMYDPQKYSVFVAITYTKLNNARKRLYHEAKNKGYKIASYISSRAFVWNNAHIGENCFIFENNVIQHHCSIGNNVILWSGNHIGHRTEIKDHCFLSSQVTIAGYCQIAENTFIGVNSTIANNLKIGKYNFIRPASVILKNTEDCKIYQGNPAEPAKVSSLRFFKVKEEIENKPKEEVKTQ